MATPAVQPVVEEGKMLSESLSTVKIQVQQMRRYLVRRDSSAGLRTANGERVIGTGPTYGCFEERKFDACRAADFLSVPQAILRIV